MNNRLFDFERDLIVDLLMKSNNYAGYKWKLFYTDDKVYLKVFYYVKGGNNGDSFICCDITDKTSYNDLLKVVNLILDKANDMLAYHAFKEGFQLDTSIVFNIVSNYQRYAINLIDSFKNDKTDLYDILLDYSCLIDNIETIVKHIDNYNFDGQDSTLNNISRNDIDTIEISIHDTYFMLNYYFKDLYEKTIF